MFEWIDVNLCQTTFDISFITTGVFEESPLPKATFVLPHTAPVGSDVSSAETCTTVSRTVSAAKRTHAMLRTTFMEQARIQSKEL